MNAKSVNDFFQFHYMFFSSRITVHGTNFELLELWRGNSTKRFARRRNEMHLILSSLYCQPLPSVCMQNVFKFGVKPNVDVPAKAGPKKHHTSDW